MRILPAAALVALAAALSAAAGPPQVGSSQYLVEPDPRLCPFPLCGGYWISLANRPWTRCSDGAVQPRCYAAIALDEQRHGLATGIPAGALARAELEPWRFEGIGELGALVVAEIRTPAGQTLAGSVYRVRDRGLRCIRAPCFSLRASKLNTPFRTALSGLDLRPALLAARERARAEADLATAGGLLAAGRIVPAGSGGRVLRVWRVYLRAAPPRA